MDDEDDEDDEDGETTHFVRRTRAGAASSGGIEGRWGETPGASEQETPAGAPLPARGYDEDLDEAEQLDGTGSAWSRPSCPRT